MKRELKNYIWIFENDIVTLVDKEKGISFVLKMDKLDSLVRAYVSFKTRRRIEMCKELRLKLRKQREAYQERIKKLTQKKKEVENGQD